VGGAREPVLSHPKIKPLFLGGISRLRPRLPLACWRGLFHRDFLGAWDWGTWAVKRFHDRWDGDATRAQKMFGKSDLLRPFSRHRLVAYAHHRGGAGRGAAGSSTWEGGQDRIGGTGAAGLGPRWKARKKKILPGWTTIGRLMLKRSVRADSSRLRAVYAPRVKEQHRRQNPYPLS